MQRWLPVIATILFTPISFEVSGWSFLFTFYAEVRVSRSSYGGVIGELAALVVSYVVLQKLCPISIFTVVRTIVFYLCVALLPMALSYFEWHSSLANILAGVAVALTILVFLLTSPLFAELMHKSTLRDRRAA